MNPSGLISTALLSVVPDAADGAHGIFHARGVEQRFADTTPPPLSIT